MDDPLLLPELSNELFEKDEPSGELAGLIELQDMRIDLAHGWLVEVPGLEDFGHLGQAMVIGQQRADQADLSLQAPQRRLRHHLQVYRRLNVHGITRFEEQADGS